MAVEDDQRAAVVPHAGSRSELDPELDDASRQRLLQRAAAIVAVLAAFFAYQRYAVDGASATFWLFVATGLVALGALPLASRPRGFELTLDVVLLTALSTMGGVAHQNGGLEAPALMWTLAVPVVALFIGGPRRGVVYLALTAGLIAGFFLFEELGYAFPTGPSAAYIHRVRALGLLGFGGFLGAVTWLFQRERQRARREVLRSRREFRQLIEATPDGVIVLRGDRVVYANPAVAPMFGRDDLDHLIGQPLLEQKDPANLEMVRQLLEWLRGDGASDGDPVEQRFTFRRFDGEVAVIEVRRVGTVVFEEEPALLLIARDVGERQRLEAQLRVADRLASVGTLAAGVAHEINNPLTYLLGNITHAQQAFVEALATGDLAPLREAAGVLEEALEGGERVKSIVRDLKSFSRDTGPGDSLVDVRDVLESTAKMAQHEIRHRARLTRDYDEDLPAVLVSAPQLGQALLNLLINAAQAIPVGAADDHEIVLRCGVEADGVVIEIRDSGGGIPEGVAQRIFDPFFTTKNDAQGTGLGLAITHNLVKRMGGTLDVENNPDRGATARIVLPRAKVSGAGVPGAPEASQRHEPSSARGRILIVDDEPYVAKAVGRMLRRHEVVIAGGGREALERLAEETFDVVLCDVMMPAMTGMDLHRRAAAERPGVERSFVFMTGGAFTSEARAYLEEVSNR